MMPCRYFVKSPSLCRLILLSLLACGHQYAGATPSQDTLMQQNTMVQPAGKVVIYQAFVRLFGNNNTTNKPWGTLAENGSGKFNDINDVALLALKRMGITHLWLTGVLHHATATDYSAYGISLDDPEVVKGRAGSPYAVKDYYDVDPDLAVNPAERLQEFQALIARAHKHGLKVVMDIIPNHVARHYQSTQKPSGVNDFGANDDTSVEYRRDNNFYYVPGKAFQLPDSPADFKVLGGEAHSRVDGQFDEFPAKWTGNGARAAKPDFNDWYETVKINYGVKPDGSYDFARLPAALANAPVSEHLKFWQQQQVPDSWRKFQQISQYWLNKGIDGFRYDMAEMVPVEFWSYLNSHIKQQKPDALLLAEVYQPALYRDYLALGKMDYLYDKVGFYDSMKAVMQGKAPTSVLLQRQHEVADIEAHLLKFLENHDEQRIASAEFAGDARKGMPAMTVSAMIGKAPILQYFGQESGEAGLLNSGFGRASRSSIFDYAGVPAHQAFLNHGRFDGGGFTKSQRQLFDFYQKLLTLTATLPALRGDFTDLHQLNLQSEGYSEQQFSFARHSAKQQLLVVSNFADKPVTFTLQLPAVVQTQWQLTKDATWLDLLTEQSIAGATPQLTLAPYQSVVLLRQ